MNPERPILLSILVCGLKERADKQMSLMANLMAQAAQHQCEVLTHIDDGTLSIGDKRNGLLQAAQGAYVAFVDDDDRVADDYVAAVCNALARHGIVENADPDCAYLEGVITVDGQNPRMFVHSIEVPEWCERNGVYYRYPNHLNAIRRDLALAVKFPSQNHGEDRSFSDRIKPLLKKQAKVRPGPLYFYDYSSSGSRSNKK